MFLRPTTLWPHRDGSISSQPLDRLLQVVLAGDILQVVTARGNVPLLNAETAGNMRGVYAMDAAGFARIEILRGFVPGLSLLSALISDPIYFEAK